VKTIFLGLLILLQAYGAASVPAQQIVSAAAVSGSVVDANGAGLPGAAVAATNLDTNQTQTAATGAVGQFRFQYLPVGAYELKISKPGFLTASRKISLAVGQTVDLEIKVEVETVGAKVDVTAASAVVETSRTQVAETILPKDVENLPLNGRNFLDLALLLPGVSRTNTGSVQRFAETSAVPGTGISVAGQRNLGNSFIVDGVSANDDAAELAGTFYSEEVIREFQVVTSGAVAEFGRASSGFVNIITQSGTNQFRGKTYGFFRSDKFDARSPIAASKDPLTQKQYGASAGFPIIKDKTFLFANFEQTRRHDTNVITILPADVALINNRLNAVNFPGPRIETGLVPGGYNASNFFARLDHQISAKNLLTASYNLYDIKGSNSRTVGGLNSISRGTGLKNTDNTFTGSDVAILSSKTLNEFRFLYRRSRLSAPVNDAAGPAINISGVASIGTATSSPTERDIDLVQLNESISHSFRNHSLKLGAEYLYNNVNIAFPGALQGVYTFTNRANFLSGTYSQFQQAFGAPSQKQLNHNFGFFVQDEWKPARALTLNLGLRYDVQDLPNPIKTDKNNLAPRFGFAYAPFEKTVIRGGFGLYFDPIPLRAVSNALQRDGSKYIVVQYSPTQPGAPIFPNVLASEPSVLLTKPNITRIDPNIENSYSQQANLQIERELPYATSVSLGYLYLRGRHIILSRNVNVPRPVTCAGPNLCRPDANFGNISWYESSGESDFNGLLFSLNKRQGRWATVRVSYTFSKSIDDAGNFFFSAPQDNFNLRDERGLSDNDQRHKFSLSGTISAPPDFAGGTAGKIFRGFMLSYIFTYNSSLPFNVQTGTDRNGDTTNNDRPAGVGRNTGRGFDYASFDMRLSRLFRLGERTSLQLLAEGFNLFNRANYAVPNNIFGTGSVPVASFGRPTAAMDARQIQLGFRLTF
jgi:Carboxypeptidase regulatory-like domain/TonB dependent receptor